jgi:hypothetical protein
MWRARRTVRAGRLGHLGYETRVPDGSRLGLEQGREGEWGRGCRPTQAMRGVGFAGRTGRRVGRGWEEERKRPWEEGGAGLCGGLGGLLRLSRLRRGRRGC